MWYFTWILGVLLACAFGIINAMWYEFHTDDYVKVSDEPQSSIDNDPFADNAMNNN